jgi:isopentenyl-diphosphate delta-isomerase
MIDMIDAHVFVVCLNFLQEVIQSEGEASAKGCLSAISQLADDLDVPVVVKESGAGISFDVAERLSNTSIAGIDVGGLGGTSFSAIEHYRANMINDKLHERGGKTFWDWGIPTPASIIEVGDATGWQLPIIATGGIRNGLDAAKAIALGASAAGIARALLDPANKDKDSTLFEVDAIVKELRAAMFLVGVNSVSKMADVEVDSWI